MPDEQQQDLSAGLEPTPGVYRFRTRRRAPWQPVRIMHDGYEWNVLVIGKVAFGSGKADPFEIPIIAHRWPLHPISQQEYDAMMAEYALAKPGSPLATPDEPVDLRRSLPL